jgi:hypothetical protein
MLAAISDNSRKHANWQILAKISQAEEKISQAEEMQPD